MLQSARLPDGEPFLREVQKRCPSPLGKRRLDRLDRSMHFAVRPVASANRESPLESTCIDRLGIDPQLVAAFVCSYELPTIVAPPALIEHSSETGDVVVQDAIRSERRVVPCQVDQARRGQDPVRVHEQDGEAGALSVAAESQRSSCSAGLE